MTTDSTPTRFLRADPGHLDGAGLAWWIDVDVASKASVDKFLDALDEDRALDPTIVSRTDLADQRTHLMGCARCLGSLNPLLTHVEKALAAHEPVPEAVRAASLVAARNAFLVDVPRQDPRLTDKKRKSSSLHFGRGRGSGVSAGSSVTTTGGLGALRPRLVVPIVLAVLATLFVAVALRDSRSPMTKSALETIASTDALMSMPSVESGAGIAEEALVDTRPGAVGATEAASAAATEAATAETQAAAAAALDTAAAEFSAGAGPSASVTDDSQNSAHPTEVQPQAAQPGPPKQPDPKRTRSDVSTTTLATKVSAAAVPSRSAADSGSFAPSRSVWLGQLGQFSDIGTARAAAEERVVSLGLLLPVPTTPSGATSNPIAAATAAPAAGAATTPGAAAATAPSKASPQSAASPCLTDDVRAWASADVGSRQVVIVVRIGIDDVLVLDASSCQPIT